MGRNANEGLAPAKLQPLNGEALLAGQNQMDSHSALVSAQFGDGLPGKGRNSGEQAGPQEREKSTDFHGRKVGFVCES